MNYIANQLVRNEKIYQIWNIFEKFDVNMGGCKA